MAQVERRDVKPEPQKEQEGSNGGGFSRRDFLVSAGAGVTGLVIGGAVGGVVGRQTAPVVPVEEVAEPVVPEEEVEELAAEAESPYKAGYTIVFDPYQCTGCMMCAVACSEKYSEEYFPEETKDTINLEFARIRPMRFQYVDVINICQYCSLEAWAEGSEEAPCQSVCPEDAIVDVPEGEGKEGYYGMGYKHVDRDKCLGADTCWRCAEICEDQFGSGISFDPIEKKAQVCSRCGGDPECVKVCPEPMALQWVPASRNGRYFANQPTAYAELLYRKMYNQRREL